MKTSERTWLTHAVITLYEVKWACKPLTWLMAAHSAVGLGCCFFPWWPTSCCCVLSWGEVAVSAVCVHNLQGRGRATAVEPGPWININTIFPDTVKCHYNAVQCDTIFHTALHWLKQSISRHVRSQITPHSSPYWASYGVYFVRIQ